MTTPSRRVRRALRLKRILKAEKEAWRIVLRAEIDRGYRYNNGCNPYISSASLFFSLFKRTRRNEGKDCRSRWTWCRCPSCKWHTAKYLARIRKKKELTLEQEYKAWE